MVKFSNLVQALNISLFIATVLLWSLGFGFYLVNLNVIIASLFCHLILAMFLVSRRSKSNPFIVLGCLHIIVFYLSRVSTLLYVQDLKYSTLQRVGGDLITANDVASFLLYLAISVCMIFAGLLMPVGRSSEVGHVSNKSLIQHGQKTTFFLIVSLGFVFIYEGFFTFKLSVEGSLFLGIFASLFDYSTVVLVASVFLCLYHGGNVLQNHKTILVLTAAIIVSICIAGSAAPLVRLGLSVLFALLACAGNFRIKITHVMLVSLLVILTSLLGSYVKAHPDASIFGSISNLGRFDDEVLWDLLLRITSRAAFLDFSIEILFNPEYGAFINFTYIFKSLIDSLTPGFDIFNLPPVANSLLSIYNKDFKGVIDRVYADSNYHSDQIGFVAEAYHLFGFGFSLIWFFIIGFVFKILHKVIFRLVQQPFYKYLCLAILLHIFWSFLQSFGLDTVLMIIVFKVIFFVFFVLFPTYCRRV